MTQHEIRQFDVFRLRGGETVVVLQHETFSDFKTRVVAPLIAKPRGKLATSLNPVLKLARGDWVLGTHLISVVTLASFADPIGSLVDQDYKIKRALDQLFLGF
jgi:CcdB protein